MWERMGKFLGLGSIVAEECTDQSQQKDGIFFSFFSISKYLKQCCLLGEEEEGEKVGMVVNGGGRDRDHLRGLSATMG